ncbi:MULTISPECIES: Holliday junction resolvase RuvX [Marinobacter]|jgi:putative Holliday junction resolvase|uniref:Putative pre-16S rRNA nuclease n=1 Tax=Marinobacter nauticus (strain ATCC 700491 / DSM 11845 / VT8) TaxID=351348 RepID=YQGF_MARN8|nr:MULTISPECIES: Holliday junction resolvase RuvX [Marinobacter]A1U763.1 RecName: Full=Putative pre-16S rRNA nuclease [Marinobacter nauticus VT8]MCG8523791.1 Holliday junction resolvase RuvX [Pseudomonadales bacterium]ABM20832.1 Holliday junction resolvase YqgF [Marinobacter nauticus VT8]ERS90072.1 Holliday junction resolvase [Marinobacter sp. C1S70]MBY5937518.1 Holliday junction resolvase RuvX [Marinobacter nauticus]MBY5954239.1 Holliday junction resolvase RuvX [Marinobacter nauticus]
MPDPGNRRLLAFDFGTRRIGVASGQEMLGTGQPLAMLPARDGIPDWQQIEALLADWQPDIVLVGLPLNMDDTENEMCARARKFGKRLHGRYHVTVEMVDERLTSYEAKGEVMAGGGSRDFGRHGVDDRAAVLILETWCREQAG